MLATLIGDGNRLKLLLGVLPERGLTRLDSAVTATRG